MTTMEEKNINIESEDIKTDEMAVEKETDEVAEQDVAETETEEMDEAEVTNPLEAAEAEIADLKDKYLRQVAEFDNYR